MGGKKQIVACWGREEQKKERERKEEDIGRDGKQVVACWGSQRFELSGEASCYREGEKFIERVEARFLWFKESRPLVACGGKGKQRKKRRRILGERVG